jgi:uncharacterized protein YbjT (DUF2867 family)
MEIFVTGATGAVGRPLVNALSRDGHEIVAATRHPDEYTGAGRPLAFDLDGGTKGAPMPLLDPDGVANGCEVAFYLIHALDDAEFANLEMRRVQRFASWWGPDRTVVYLGGLGPDDTPSEHLRSRHAVGAHLAEHCRTVELRASLVIGAESLSFQLLARLGDLAGRSLLPVPVPEASTTRTQPIAEADIVQLLVEAIDLDPGIYEVGGPDVVTYQDLIERSARLQGHDLDTRAVVPIDADWLGPAAALAAGTDPWATSALFAGMSTEAVVRPGHGLPEGLEPSTDLDDAIALALAAMVG